MKRIFLFPVLAVFLPLSAIAANFAATLDRNRIGQGENVTLQLTLSGTKAKGDPDIGALKQLFTIVSEAQSSDITIVNGAASFSNGWQYTLSPKREGQISIPAMKIETDAGTLHTAPVMLEVDHASPQVLPQMGTGEGMVSLSAKASMATPYQNQPILYTIRCVVRGDVSDAALSDISISNAIVQREGKPSVHDEIEKGGTVRVVELHFIITPLQPGKITIPPAVLKGKIQEPDIAPMTDPFGGGFLFSPGTRQALNFFSSFGGEPFTVASNTTVLDVKSPARAMDPWLPLKSLNIKEDIDTSQPVHVGEPLTRKITLSAEGAVGSQLPDTNVQQDQANVRIYADKPAMGENVDEKAGAIFGWRKESYSLVPLKAGHLVLPAIRVAWWDIVNNKLATAELPKRILDVLPGVAVRKPAVANSGVVRKNVTAMPKPAATTQSIITRTALTKKVFPILYGVASVLAALLSIFIFLYWMAQRKTNRARAVAQPIAEAALKQVHTAEELKSFLQAYAHDHWGVSQNASLEIIFAPQRKLRARPDIEIVIKEIGAALYANKPVDVEDLKKRCRRIIAVQRKRARGPRKGAEKLPLLNPS
ncbi:MAG TPA: BatD family protein [Rhizomicrobium sp.]